MKQFIAPSYTFTPGASGVGTVNLSGISGFNVKYLVAIINQTRGVVIYSTGDTATRYTNLSGTTLTLNVDTSTHNSGDVLQVIYEVTSTDPLTDSQLRATAVPVSGTVTANTGLTQPLTDTQLRASAVPVSGAFFQATQPVSAASLPLPSGAATETTLSSIDGKLGSLGQKTMANSAPVVIASDQSAIPITGSITASNPSVGTTGSAVPASGTLIGGTDGRWDDWISGPCIRYADRRHRRNQPSRHQDRCER